MSSSLLGGSVAVGATRRSRAGDSSLVVAPMRVLRAAGAAGLGAARRSWFSSSGTRGVAVRGGAHPKVMAFVRVHYFVDEVSGGEVPAVGPATLGVFGTSVTHSTPTVETGSGLKRGHCHLPGPRARAAVRRAPHGRHSGTALGQEPRSAGCGARAG